MYNTNDCAVSPPRKEKNDEHIEDEGCLDVTRHVLLRGASLADWRKGILLTFQG
jgi:hypothetical protein